MITPTPLPTIYSYEDHRAYLKDWYRHMKQSHRGFTHRSFAKKAGFQTSNFLLLVMQGKRHLTEASINKVMKGMSLSKPEQDFFRHLVFFNQATTPEERQQYCDRLHQSKQYRALKPIDHWQYEYYSKWYHPVIRELAAAPACDGTPEWLAAQLHPSVTPTQCAKSIEILEHLGFIRKRGIRWEQTSPIVSTGPRLTSVVVHNYHKQMLDLAKDLLDELPAEQRDVSAITVGVSRIQYGLIREKIREFRQEILRLTAGTAATEQVMQLCMQFFPLSR